MSVDTLEKIDAIALKRQDFMTNQEVRWCPGCGNYAILACMQKLLPTLGVPQEKHVFVSGIGCSSRFPYYLNTYGFHTIHGRAPAVATGLKMAQPALSVWIVTGDGDGFSIGASHLIHLMRRNVDVTVLLFNNRIYGLTKGQFSPTSEMGKKTKTSPQGNIDFPINPIALAIGANCSFIARAIDVDSVGLAKTLKAAHAHKGTSFVEIYQNCAVFNNGAFSGFTDQKFRDKWTVSLTPNAPLLFGDNQYGLVQSDNGKLAIKALKTEADRSKVVLHNPADQTQALQLSQLSLPEHPVPIGVFRQTERPVYEALVQQQAEYTEKSTKPNDNELLAAFSGAEGYSVISD